MYYEVARVGTYPGHVYALVEFWQGDRNGPPVIVNDFLIEVGPADVLTALTQSIETFVKHATDAGLTGDLTDPSIPIGDGLAGLTLPLAGTVSVG